MRPRTASILIVLATSLALAGIATACAAPYLRAGYGGHQLRMPTLNGRVFAYETQVGRVAPGEVHDIGPGYGPELSAGLWLTPALRVGATYGFQRAVHQTRYDYPGVGVWTHRADLRISSIGGEAAVRVPLPRFQGLTLGVEAAASRGELIESVENQPASMGGWRRTAHQVRPSWGAFVGIDQTNPQGVAGFVRAGYRQRDLGSMPSGLTTYSFEGVTTLPGGDVDLDFSGFYVTVGVGFDGRR